MAPLRSYHSPPASSLSVASSPRRPRKSTAVARREEKAALLQELEVLRAWLRLRRERQRERRVAELKREAAVASAEPSDHDEAGAAALVEVSTFDARTVAKAETLLRLQRAVRDCHLLVSSARGLLGAHSATMCREALYTTLSLPAGTAQRRETLRLCHAQAIRDADEFLRARCTGVDLRAPFSSQERFQDPATGDLCVLYFEVTQFPGVRSVVDVYHAMRFWATNLEICVSEQLGDVTVREDTEDDENDESTPRGQAFSSARRIRSQLQCGVSVGSSQAVFAQVCDDEDCVVFAVQPVDADARSVALEAGNDISFRATAVLRVERVDGVVVLTRWARIAFRATRDPTRVTRDHLRAALLAGVGRWFEVFQRVVWEQLNAIAQPRHDTENEHEAASTWHVPQPLLFDMR